MSLFGFEQGEQKNESRVHELVDMIVEEVSDVDRAANKRTYLVIKRRPDMEHGEAQGASTAANAKSSEGESPRPAEPPTPAPAPAAVEPQSKQALVLSESMKTNLVRWVMEAWNRLGTLVQALKDAQTTADADAKLPDSVSRELSSVAEILSTAARSAPAPVASSENAEAASVAVEGSRKQLAEMLEVLGQVIAAMQTNSQMMASTKAAPDGAGAGERSLDPSTPNAGAGVQPDEASVTDARTALQNVPGLADVLKQMGDLKAELAELRPEVARLRKSTGLPASRTAEHASPRSAPEPDAVHWARDMNRPLGKDHVPPEISFYE